MVARLPRNTGEQARSRATSCDPARLRYPPVITPSPSAATTDGSDTDDALDAMGCRGSEVQILSLRPFILLVGKSLRRRYRCAREQDGSSDYHLTGQRRAGGWQAPPPVSDLWRLNRRPHTRLRRGSKVQLRGTNRTSAPGGSVRRPTTPGALWLFGQRLRTGTGSGSGHHGARRDGAAERPSRSGCGTSWRDASPGCCCGSKVRCCCGWLTAR